MVMGRIGLPDGTAELVAALSRAYEHVRRSKGARTAGVDGETAKHWRGSEGSRISELAAELQEGRYLPQPTRRTMIPKASGGKRPLGIPTFRDRIVQQAVREELEPRMEQRFLACSHGFRPGRGPITAIAAVKAALPAADFAVGGDIAGCFNALSHPRILDNLREDADERVLNLVEAMLRAGTVEDDCWVGTTQGVPQGGVLSPLLANRYLHDLDVVVEPLVADRGGTYVRYADDFVILVTGTWQDAADIQRHVAGHLAELNLTRAPGKGGTFPTREGLSFLGLRFFRKRATGGAWDTGIAIPKETAQARRQRTDAIFRDAAVGADPELRTRQSTRLHADFQGWYSYYQAARDSAPTLRKLERQFQQRYLEWEARNKEANWLKVQPA